VERHVRKIGQEFTIVPFSRDDGVIEIIEQRKAPLVWIPSRLEEALKVEKEFNAILLEKYSKAIEVFLDRSGLTP
jgi:hypothetical protein